MFRALLLRAAQCLRVTSVGVREFASGAARSRTSASASASASASGSACASAAPATKPSVSERKPVSTDKKTPSWELRRQQGLKSSELKPGEKLSWERILIESGEVPASKRKQFRQVPVDPKILEYLTAHHLGRDRPDARRKRLADMRKSPTGYKPPPDSEFTQSPASIPVAKGPEVAFAGRSNVGKSSLINALPRGGTSVVRVSDKPGETQTINFYRINRTGLKALLTLVDLPGHGFAFAKPEKIEQWTELIRTYCTSRTALKRVLLLVDARHGLKPSDRAFIAALESAGTRYQIVLTKADLVAIDDLARRVHLTRAELATKHPHAVQRILVVSARSGAGLSELRRELAGLCLRKDGNSAAAAAAATAPVTSWAKRVGADSPEGAGTSVAADAKQKNVGQKQTRRKSQPKNPKQDSEKRPGNNRPSVSRSERVSEPAPTPEEEAALKQQAAFAERMRRRSLAALSRAGLDDMHRERLKQVRRERFESGQELKRLRERVQRAEADREEQTALPTSPAARRPRVSDKGV